jgi:Helix-turn-helix domain of resolvase
VRPPWQRHPSRHRTPSHDRPSRHRRHLASAQSNEIPRQASDLGPVLADIRLAGHKSYEAIAKAQGMGATEIAKALKIGRASVYRALEGA